MKTRRERQEKLSVRPVTLSDLKSIVRLYQEHRAIMAKYEASDIISPGDFGVPIYAAVYDGTVVAYAYITTNAAEQLAICNITNREYQDLDLNEILYREAEARYIGKYEVDQVRLKAEILADWLNLCLN